MTKVVISSVAKSTPFDNSTNGFVATDTQAAIEEVKTAIATTIRAGNIAAVSFTGSPRKYTITFSPAFANTNYAVTVTGSSDDRVWTYETKTTTNVTINSNAAKALTGEVSWVAAVNGGGS